jgi:hypothetical protein
VPTDCPSTSYCKVAGCASAGGTCTPKPPLTAAIGPVCGCDNVTYFNASLAANDWMNVKATGPCPAITAVKCTNGQCGGDLTCNRGGQCNGIAAGTCWKIPDTCNATSASEPSRYRLCPGSGGGNDCLTACEAIETEKAFYEDPLCK